LGCGHLTLVFGYAKNLHVYGVLMLPGKPDIFMFHALDCYNMYGRGRIAVVKFDRGSTHFAHLIRQTVCMDGVFYGVGASRST
jgi:hypothetical protein